MKRSLIALAVAGLLANVAFAQPTLTGDDSYSDVHLSAWKGAPEMTTFQSKEIVGAESNTYGQYGIYEFNP
jgi:hypothetical protein